MGYTGQAVFGGTTDPVTGSWTSATALNSTVVSSDITGYGVVVASFFVTGTVTAGTAVFEVSDDAGTTWWPIAGLQTGSSTQATSVAVTSSTSWEFATGAYNLFRVRLNPVITGSGTVNIRLSAEAFPFTTAIAVAGTVSVQTVSGNNAVRLQDGSGNSISSTSNSLNVNITGGSSSGTQYTGSPTVSSSAIVTTAASGYDGANVRPLLTSNTGQLHVIADSGSTTVVTGTVAVTQSGTWTVQQGTPPWTIQGDSASGTAKAGNPVQIGGVFNTTQPTVTTGQTVESQATARGALIVATGVDAFAVNASQSGTWNIGTLTSITNTVTVSGTVTANQGTSPWVTNISQFGGNNVVIGTGASGSGVPRVTVSNDSNILATQSGTWSVRTLGNNGLALDGASGAATPPQTVQVGGSDGTNLRVLNTSTTGQLHVLTDSGSTVRVTGNAGATLDGTVGAGTAPTNMVAVGGVFNSSAPVPTTGQSMAIQLDQAGNQRIMPGIALTTLATQGTALNSAQTILSNTGAPAVLVQLTQTTTLTAGAITFEVSYDGSNFVAMSADAVLDPTSATFAQIALPYTVQASTNKQFLLLTHGAQTLRIRTSTAITGTGTVTPNYALLPVSPVKEVVAFSPTAANFNATVVQATGSNLHVVLDSGTLTSITNTVTVSGTVTANQGGAPWSQNLTQVASTTLGTPQTFGTAPTGVVIGTSSDIYIAGTRARSNQTTTAAGVVDVNIVGSLGATNSVTNGTFMAITDNTTKVGVIAGTTALKTDMSSVAGTATSTAAAGVQKVGVVGGTGTSLETTAGVLDYNLKNVNNAAVNIGTGASGTGTQRVAVANDSQIKIWDGTNQAGVDTLLSLKTTTPDRTGAISLTAVGQTAQIAMEGRGTWSFVLSSIGTGGQVVIEGSLDGSNWFGIDVWSEFSETWIINPATVSSTGNWWAEPLTYAFVRVRCTALTSGTITGTMLASFAPMLTFEYQAGEGTTFPNNLIAIGGKGSSDGLMHGVKVDASGSLQVTQSPASTSNTSAATWNSATALNTTVVLNSAAFTYASLLLTLNTTSTITAGAVTFEVSNDASNWVAISGVNAGQFGSLGVNGVYPLSASTYVTGIFNTTAWQNFRVRLSTAITGTGALTIGFAAQAAGAPPIVAREPKDFGRTFICITQDDVAAPAAEALTTFTINKGGTVTSGTTYTVTAGKTLRLQSVNVSNRSTSGTQDVKTRIRSAASVLATSPILWQTLTSATTTVFDRDSENWPDGLEVPGGQQIGISQVNVGGNTTGLITLSFVGYEY